MSTRLPTTAEPNRKLISYINVKLALLGAAVPARRRATGSLPKSPRRWLPAIARRSDCSPVIFRPADQRIQTFLYDYLQDIPVAKLPNQTFVLDRPGLARAVVPAAGSRRIAVADHPFVSRQARRAAQSASRPPHNPGHFSRRRRRACRFRDDKLAVPKAVFGKMLGPGAEPAARTDAPAVHRDQPQPAECFVSLLLRPVVCPEVPGFIAEKSMEIRFFAPGSLVSNLDFVESIFGNAGDPFLPDNDAGLDVEHWTGHTGCVILAPHLQR